METVNSTIAVIARVAVIAELMVSIQSLRPISEFFWAITAIVAIMWKSGSKFTAEFTRFRKSGCMTCQKPMIVLLKLHLPNLINVRVSHASTSHVYYNNAQKFINSIQILSWVSLSEYICQSVKHPHFRSIYLVDVRAWRYLRWLLNVYQALIPGKRFLNPRQGSIPQPFDADMTGETL